MVPPAALVRDGADPADAQTFVVVNGKAERRDVTVGVEAPDAIQVTSGLKAGEVVVLDPPSALAPGTPVEVQTAARSESQRGLERMFLSDLSIKQPVFATMMMAALAVLGPDLVPGAEGRSLSRRRDSRSSP